MHSHPFANFDDGEYVYANRQIQSGLNWDTFKWAFTTRSQGNWHPLTWLSHALDSQIFGSNPAGYHDVNLLFHVLNVLLLFWVLKQVTGMAERSALVAGLFALHPINVESVAWIAERKNVLSMLFFLLALGMYQWYARDPRRIGRYVGVALLFALGLMAKPQIITLPFVLLLWDYWPLRRMFAEGDNPSPENRRFVPGHLSRLLLEKVPLFVIAAASAVLTFKVQQAGGALAYTHYSLGVRLENAIVSYVMYLKDAVWPSGLSLLYIHPGTSLRISYVIGSLLLLLVISAVVFWQRQHRYLTVGWLWFLGTLIPMIGIVQVSRQARADRYAYLSFIGLFLMTCWGLADWARQRRVPAMWLRSASVCVLVALGALAYRQVGFWSDNVTLWSHAVEVTRGNFVAENILGSELLDRNDFEAAIPHFRAAQALNPSDSTAYLYIGTYDQHHGQLHEAIEQYQNAIERAATEPNPYVQATASARMGSAYGALGQFVEAENSFRNALKVTPDDASMWIALGMATRMAGDTNGAISAFSEATKIQPSDVGYLLLAQVLQQAGRFTEAQDARLRAQRLSSDFAQAQQTANSLLGR